MTIIASDSPAAQSLLADSLDASSQQMVANEPRTIGLANNPSPFELLFSQRINSSDLANLVVQNSPSSGVIGETPHSAELGQHALKQGTSSQTDSIGAASLVNPLSIPVGIPRFTTTVNPSISNHGLAAGSDVARKVSSSSLSAEGELKTTATPKGEWLQLASTTSNEAQRVAAGNLAGQPATAGNVDEGAEAARLFHEILSSIELTNTSNPDAVHSTSGIQKTGDASEAFEALPITIYSISISGGGSDFDGSISEKNSAIVDSADVTLPAQRIALHGDKTNTPDIAVLPQLNVVRGPVSESAPAVTEELATAVAETLEQEPGTGPVTIRIQMDRQDLGSINLHVTMSNDVVSIRVVTHEQLAHHLIDSQIEDLRQSLNDRGINCGRIQIDCDSTGQQFSDRKKPSQTMMAMGLPASRWGRLQTAESATARQESRLNFVA